MLDTATIIAHVMFRHGAIITVPNLCKTLDQCLERPSHGAYDLAHDGDDVMVAEFAQTRVVLIAGHRISAKTCFSVTIAVSPKDEDAIASPTLSSRHNRLILDIVAQVKQPSNSCGVLWQRTKAPITAQILVGIVAALSDQMALLDSNCGWLPEGASSLESKQIVPASALALQFQPRQPI